MPDRIKDRKVKVERQDSEPSPKVTGASSAAFLIAFIDAIAAGDIDPVKFGIAFAVAVVGWAIKDRIKWADLLRTARGAGLEV